MSGDFVPNPSPSYLTPAIVYGRFDRVMDETDPAIIDDQIAYGLEVEAAGGTFFNNFINNMPGDYYRSIMPTHMLDRPITTDPTSLDEANPLARSRLSAEKTWGQFFDEVDQAIELVGLDVGEITRLQEAFQTQGSPETQHAYTQYILPAYRLLRIWGYSHGDLSR